MKISYQYRIMSTKWKWRVSLMGGVISYSTLFGGKASAKSARGVTVSQHGNGRSGGRRAYMKSENNVSASKIENTSSLKRKYLRVLQPAYCAVNVAVTLGINGVKADIPMKASREEKPHAAAAKLIRRGVVMAILAGCGVSSIFNDNLQ